MDPRGVDPAPAEPFEPGAAAPVELGIEGITDAVLVGRGGYGAVYRARQIRFHREVAVKVLTGELDAAAAVRFERECAAMGSLSGHPHIVTIFDSGVAVMSPTSSWSTCRAGRCTTSSRKGRSRGSTCSTMA